MFCDYCDCIDCKKGTKHISHAKTINGKWICDVCYDYEICQTIQEAYRNPCPIDVKCSHRPELITEWIKYDKKI